MVEQKRLTLAGDGVKKVDATESTSHDGVDAVSSALETNTSIASAVGEDVTLTHLNQGKLNVVAVREEICLGRVSAEAGEVRAKCRAAM